MAAGQWSRLEEVRPSGKAADFISVAFEGGVDTFFLALHRAGQEAGEELCEGDLLAVSGAVDAEPGDLVVWWTGTPQSQALARVRDDLTLEPVAGFPPPAGGRRREPSPALRGVVVGRLRRMAT